MPVTSKSFHIFMYVILMYVILMYIILMYVILMCVILMCVILMYVFPESVYFASLSVVCGILRNYQLYNDSINF